MGPTKDQKQSFIFGILNCQVEQWQQLDRTSLKVLFAQMPTKDLSFIELGFWDRVNEVRLGNWGGDGLPMKMEQKNQKNCHLSIPNKPQVQIQSYKIMYIF